MWYIGFATLSYNVSSDTNDLQGFSYPLEEELDDFYTAKNLLK